MLAANSCKCHTLTLSFLFIYLFIYFLQETLEGKTRLVPIKIAGLKSKTRETQLPN